MTAKILYSEIPLTQVEALLLLTLYWAKFLRLMKADGRAIEVRA